MGGIPLFNEGRLATRLDSEEFLPDLPYNADSRKVTARSPRDRGRRNGRRADGEGVHQLLSFP